MKVLHISNFKNISGWSSQALNHILALHSAGIDVIPRHVNILNNLNPDIPQTVKDLEGKDCINPDIIIFNTLPSYYEKSGRAKCLGYFVCETSNFRTSGWTKYMNMMDALACPCYHNKVAATDSGVKTKIHIVPECIDISKYSKEYPVHPLRSQHKDKFIFLCVAEWTTRKNIDAIVKAFHTEFAPSEPVELVIKTTPAGMSNPQQEIGSKLDSIKRGLKLYNSLERYKRENVICGFLTEDDLTSLYQSVDCIVNTSRGEAFCIPVAVGMACGKTIISGDRGGLDYVNEKNAYVLDSVEQSCFDANDTLADLYTGMEYWREVRLQSLRAAMRSAFEKRSLNLRKQQQAKKDIQEFSIEKVGKIYKNILEKIL